MIHELANAFSDLLITQLQQADAIEAKKSLVGYYGV